MSTTQPNVSSTPLSGGLSPASARKWTRWKEVVIEGLIWVAGVSAIVIMALIFFFLLREGISAFLDIPLRQLFGNRWYPIEGIFGLWPLLAGSILVTAGAVIISVPLGITTAIYLGEIAPSWQRELLKPVIEVLAGIPSIVLGFVGWVALAPLIQQFGAPTGLTAFTGSLLLAYMALPTIISLSEDALKSVPESYRQASLALGASHWQTLIRVKIPAALSGIIAACMLGMGRAIGETMTVLMATGCAPAMPRSFLDSVRTMTSTIAIELGEVPYNTTHYYALFGIGLVLFIITFIVNMASDIILHKYEKKTK